MKVSLSLAWALHDERREETVDKQLFDLLDGIQTGGNLRFAAEQLGVSYRYAWGKLKRWESFVGADLVVRARGRGATLTSAGIALLQARRIAELALEGELSAMARQINDTLSASFTSSARAVVLASSHSDLMRELAQDLGNSAEVKFDIVGSEQALRRLRRGEAQLAGFHIPLGALGASVGQYLMHLIAADALLFEVETRELGFICRKEKVCGSLEELARGNYKFINRQSGSGTRLVMDGLLGAAAIAPGKIDGYQYEEFTHSAVAALVASGEADVGFGVATAAQRMGLKFTPLVREVFYLALTPQLDEAIREAVLLFLDRNGAPSSHLSLQRMTHRHIA
ncbi:MAG: substrate-binding domain-containing protein [Pseudomonadota bacterium]